MATKKNPAARTPKASGKSIPQSQRKRKKTSFTLSPESIRMLDEMAVSSNRSKVLDDLIFSAYQTFRNT